MKNIILLIALVFASLSQAATTKIPATMLSGIYRLKFSTDTTTLTYAGSGAYTLATLTSAPVGTFITYTYASSTNTRTQTTTAPTQTVADMNTNGILLYTRAFNAASTAAQPSSIAIQIGKSIKGVSRSTYKSAGKLISGELDAIVVNTTTEYGALYNSYNETTGILLIDLGQTSLTTTTNHSLIFSDQSGQASGYLVINAFGIE